MLPGFDLEGGGGGVGAGGGGSFFLCTETWPRCFVIKQVNDLDGAIKEVQQSEENEEKIPETLSAPGQHHYQSNNNCNSSNASPFLPMLPWWFTAECRHQLLSVPGPEQFIRSNTPEQRPPSSICGAIPLNEEQLKARLTKQLEFYFSRENLINDRYLRCQMDADQYVPIKIVANFPKVAQLSTDFDLIVNVLKSSSQVQVDESGTKVRPMSKRCTIILREIPQNADENEVKSMFQSEDGQCPPYLSLAYGLNDSWYVTFQTEEETQQAFFHLQTLGKTFNGKPVFARIKNGGAPIGADHRNSPDVHQQLLRFSENGLHGQLIIHDLDIERSTTPNSQQHLRPCERGGGGGGEIEHELEDEMRKRKVSASSTATNNLAVVASSTSPGPFNLGQILAKYGYVPRATFRPNIPPPTSSVLPPLQPTTTGIGTLLNGLPQPTSYFTQPILRNVGQNENIIRQQAKETGVEVSPVLVPSSIPRITDDPRINGKGASPISNNHVTAAAVINRRISSPPPQTPIGGGGGFKGFQRQESVEAYQLAMAANGLNKQKRQHFEEKNDGIEKEINERSQKSIRGNSIEQQIPKSLLNSYGPRRSEVPPLQQQSSLSSQTCNIQQLCPLSEATISLNWRQHEAANTNKQTKQQQKLSADLRQTNIQQQQQQWTPLHSLSQQQQHSSSSSALITRNVQPLLSLSQALNSSGQQHPPYSFNQFVQQLQAGNTRKIFDRNKSSYGGRDQAIVPPFRGAQNTNPYKPRTWSTSNSDWLNKQQKLGNNEGGQWQGVGRNAGIKRQQQQQRWVDVDGGIGIKGGSTSSKTVMRRSGGEYNVNNNTPIVMSNNVLLQQQQQQLFFDEKRGERGEMLEKHQKQQNKFLYSQQQQDGRQQPKKGRPPFASSNRPTRPTSIRFPEGNNMSAEKEYGVVVDQHNFSNLKGLNKIDEQKYDEQQQQQPSSYNFEEHVEEFPALSLSQTNSRKASECHSEQPSPSSPKLLLDQQQASLFSIKQPFSVVVAGGGGGGNGGRPRRATIGTSTATCTTTCGNVRKMNNNNENVYLTVGGEQTTRTPRSDTISCGSGGGMGGQQQEQQQLLLGQQRRSYAQAMLKRNNVSGVGGSVVTGGEEERSSALAKDRKNSTCKESIENNNKNDDNNTNFPPISSLGTEV